MNNSTAVAFILILIIVGLIAAAFFGSTYMMKKAIRFIIRSLRDQGATSPQSAVWPASVGIKPRSFLQPGIMRDYKPSAFQFLTNNDIVRMTEDGRIYLSEEALAQSRIAGNIQ